MATILEFRTQREPEPKSRGGRRKRRTAEIVIFPGVRYERIAEPAERAPSAKKPGVVRDTLTLAE